MAEPVSAILLRALRLVERRRPDAYGAMAAALDGLSIEIAIEGRVTLVGRGGGVVEGSVEGFVEGVADLRLSASRAAMMALLDGETTLLAAVRGGAIDLAGATSALSRGLGAFEFFVGALLKIEGAEELRRALEGWDE